MSALEEIRGRLTRASARFQQEERSKDSNLRSATILAVRASQEDAARLLAAVEAVLDLHQPEQCTDDDGLLIDLYTCSECLTSEDGEIVHVLDPCPTVKAITAALGGAA